MLDLLDWESATHSLPMYKYRDIYNIFWTSFISIRYHLPFVNTQRTRVKTVAYTDSCAKTSI
jgi:hypothetical protein